MRLATRKGFIVCLLYTRIFCFLLQMLTFFFFRYYFHLLQNSIKGLRWLAIKDSQMYIHIKVKVLSCVQLFQIPWTVACQAPLSTEFSRQEYWSGLLFSSPGDLPDPRIEPTTPVFPVMQADSLLLKPTGSQASYFLTCLNLVLLQWISSQS